jgi:Uncharacterised nucleotidyltransferase
MRSSPPASPAREEAAAATIARALRDPVGSPPALPAVDVAALIAAAVQHRVLLLSGWRLRAAGTLGDWPADFIQAFLRAEPDAVTVDCLRHSELVTVLAELSAVGVRVTLFKGAALAHTHYPAPHLRVRADTDLLVAASEVRALEDVLGRLGYARQVETSGRLVSYQSHFHKIDRYGVMHAFDVHWKISNLQVLADRFTCQELWEHRVPLAALGSAAVTVDAVHALLLALVHRAGHHPRSRNLLWIFDLHVLASRLTPEEMGWVQQIAGARGLAHIVADGLALARDWCGTAAVDPVVDALRATGPHREDAIVIQGPWTQAGVLRLDLDALPNWRARCRLIREHLLPSTGYMRARYGVRSNFLLPGLYVWRVLLGAPKWLRSHRTDE